MIPLRLQSRIALGLSPTPRPGLVLLPLGMALGTAGLSLLSEPVLSYLDPVVSVSLAALGVFAGLDIDFRRRREAALLTAASVEGGVTILLVAAGMFAVQSRLGLSDSLLWPTILLMGISAAVSSTASNDAPDHYESLSARVGDLDDVLPIVLGGFVLAAIPAGLSLPTASIALQAGVVAIVIATAGWLLIAQASGEGEQHVFVAGTLLLLGGAAAYLSMSPLWVGFCGGILWSFTRGSARQSIDRDMRYLQHPLIVLLLLVAGARLQLSVIVIAAAAVYLVCRAVGKLMGGWLVAYAVTSDLPSDLGRRLLSPGVIAVASAVNVVQIVHQSDAQSDAASMLLGVAVIGSLGSELLSVAAHPRRSLP